MKLLELSETYARLNFFNDHTHSTFLRAVDLFIRRSGVEECEGINFDAIIKFKEATLVVANGITYNGYLGYLRIIGRHAVEMGYLEINWFKRVKFAPTKSTIPKTLETTAILAATKHIEANSDQYDPDWFWIGVIKFLTYTGMRRRQLVCLRVGHFNLDKRLLKLSYEGSKTNREWLIPLHNELLPIITLFFVELQIKLGRPLRDDDTFFNRYFLGLKFVANSKRPDGLRPEAITEFFKRIKRRSGIDLGAHKFRHTFATELCNPASGDVDLFTVQHLLGHTTLQTTRGYVQTNPDQMFQTISKIQPLETRTSLAEQE